MKLKQIIASILLALLVGCGPSTPKSTANSFVEAIQDGKVDKAKRYTTEPAAVMLIVTSKLHMPNIKDYKFVKEQINGNTAVVYYTANGSEEEKKFNLVKVDGDWKIAVGKWVW